jgi:WD40 repeat protein
MHPRIFDLIRRLSLAGVVLLLPGCGAGGPDGVWKERGVLSRPECGIQAVAVASDGRTAASAESEGIVRLWDLSTRAEKACLRAHAAPPSALAFSPDGRVLASCGRDRTVRLWDVETAQPRACLTENCRCEKCLKGLTSDAVGPRARLAGHVAGVLAIAFAPDGETLAAGCADGTVVLWDVATGRSRSRLSTGHRIVQALTYAPDGRTLATAGLDCQVRLWDTAPGDTTPRERAVLRGHTGQVLVLVFAPDGQTLFSAGWDGTVRRWDPEAGTERGHWEAIDGQVQSLAVSPDGRTVAVGGTRHILRLWDASTGRLQAELDGHREWVTGLAFTPDSRGLLSAGGGDGMVKVWELSSDR